MRKTLLTVLFAVAVAACGGKSRPADPATGGGEGARLAEGHEHQEEHPELTPEMHAFHEVLAPLWHAEAGPDREPSTCAGAADLAAGVASIDAAGAPEGVEPTDWASAVATLQGALQALTEGCTAGDSASFEARFTAVHDSFHALMELLGTRGPAV